MTWKEFKEFVDGELIKQGKSGAEEIFFIDTGSYPDSDFLEVVAGAEIVITSTA